MRLALATLLLAGCYGPAVIDGLPCTETHQCPEGQHCLFGPELCLDELPPHAVFAQISAGSQHTCAIGQDEGLYCWGGNRAGELGVGDTTPRARSTRVGAGTGWTDVAAGGLFTVAVQDGELYGWGEAFFVGNGGPSAPTVIEPGEAWRAVVAGDGGWCALDEDGLARCLHQGEPLEIAMPDGWDEVSIAGGHVCGRRGGDLYCWGVGTSGQLGDGAMATSAEPVPVEGDRAWTAVAAGTTHTCAIDDAGDVWCWGDNASGQCARADLGDKLATPERVEGISGAVAIASGWSTTCASQENGTTWCWGAGAYGQIGDNLADRAAIIPSPVLVTPLASMSVGVEHTCGLDFGGSAWCWGNDADGQVGDGTIGRAATPTLVDETRAWARVFVGERHACAIAEPGLTAWCWGKNGRGQLGDGTTLRRVSPTEVRDLAGVGWLTLSPGWDHTCGISTDGSLWCWGAADRGQLGLGAGPDLHEPAQVGDARYDEVAAGDGGTCAIDDDAALRCWGSARGSAPAPLPGGGWSALARGSGGVQCAARAGDVACWSVDDVAAPAANLSDHDPDRVARGAEHTCGVNSQANGAMRCFGQDDQGELGDGPAVNPDTTVTPTIAEGWTHVVAGNQFTCGLRDGALYCWGWNGFGQLGDGSLTGRDEPASIDEGPWIELSAAGNTACAIREDGRSLHCWGIDHGLGGGWDVPTIVLAP